MQKRIGEDNDGIKLNDSNGRDINNDNKSNNNTNINNDEQFVNNNNDLKKDDSKEEEKEEDIFLPPYVGLVVCRPAPPPFDSLQLPQLPHSSRRFQLPPPKLSHSRFLPSPSSSLFNRVLESASNELMGVGDKSVDLAFVKSSGGCINNANFNRFNNYASPQKALNVSSYLFPGELVMLPLPSCVVGDIISTIKGVEISKDEKVGDNTRCIGKVPSKGNNEGKSNEDILCDVTTDKGSSISSSSSCCCLCYNNANYSLLNTSRTFTDTSINEDYGEKRERLLDQIKLRYFGHYYGTFRRVYGNDKYEKHGNCAKTMEVIYNSTRTRKKTFPGRENVTPFTIASNRGKNDKVSLDLYDKEFVHLLLTSLLRPLSPRNKDNDVGGGNNTSSITADTNGKREELKEKEVPEKNEILIKKVTEEVDEEKMMRKRLKNMQEFNSYSEIKKSKEMAGEIEENEGFRSLREQQRQRNTLLLLCSVLKEHVNLSGMLKKEGKNQEDDDRTEDESDDDSDEDKNEGGDGLENERYNDTISIFDYLFRNSYNSDNNNSNNNKPCIEDIEAYSTYLSSPSLPFWDDFPVSIYKVTYTAEGMVKIDSDEDPTTGYEDKKGHVGSLQPPQSVPQSSLDNMSIPSLLLLLRHNPDILADLLITIHNIYNIYIERYRYLSSSTPKFFSSLNKRIGQQKSDDETHMLVRAWIENKYVKIMIKILRKTMENVLFKGLLVFLPMSMRWFEFFHENNNDSENLIKNNPDNSGGDGDKDYFQFDNDDDEDKDFRLYLYAIELTQSVTFVVSKIVEYDEQILKRRRLLPLDNSEKRRRSLKLSSNNVISQDADNSIERFESLSRAGGIGNIEKDSEGNFSYVPMLLTPCYPLFLSIAPSDSRPFEYSSLTFTDAVTLLISANANMLLSTRCKLSSLSPRKRQVSSSTPLQSSSSLLAKTILLESYYDSAVNKSKMIINHAAELFSALLMKLFGYLFRINDGNNLQTQLEQPRASPFGLSPSLSPETIIEIKTFAIEFITIETVRELYKVVCSL